MINPGYNRLAEVSNKLGALIKHWNKEHTGILFKDERTSQYILQFIIDLKRIKEGIDG